MKKKIFKIINPFCTLFNIKNHNKSIETECIFGEEFLLSEIVNGYGKGTLLRDNYTGWIKLNNLGFLKTHTHKVIIPNAPIYLNANAKSGILYNLPMGSLIRVLKTKNGWSEIYLPVFNNIKFGFVPNNFIDFFENINLDWVLFSNLFLNAPYKWGGKSFCGIDCSGLVQVALQTAKNINIPRNSNQQILYAKQVGETINQNERGALIFWKDHVAIGLDEEHIIHSNAHHMRTEIETFSNAKQRILKQYGEVVSIIRLNF